MFLSSPEKTRFDRYWRREGDCHIWQLTLDKDGYGSFYLRKKNRRAHRVAYFTRFGPIPAGLVVNHKCRNRACVNPDHLEVVSRRDNSLKDTSSPAFLNALKTHCPQGHPYDRHYGKQRYCSTSERAKKKRLRQKWKTQADTTAC